MAAMLISLEEMQNETKMRTSHAHNGRRRQIKQKKHGKQLESALIQV